jgi:hypothetical protein
VLLVCLTLSLCSNYTLLERVSMVVLGVLVLCVGVSVIVIGPDLGALLTGLFVPRPPVYPEWLLTTPKYFQEFAGRSPWLEVSLYLGAVGGGAYDYIGYVGMLREKKWGLAGRPALTRAELESALAADSTGKNVTLDRAQTWTRAPLIDTTVSFFFVILVTLSFAVLAVLVLHSVPVAPANNDLLNEQEVFLARWHEGLRWVYRVGVFLAFIGTLYGAFEIYRRTFVESARAIIPKLAAANRVAATERCVVAYCFLGGLLMVWLPETIAGNIIKRMTFGGIISGATSCGLWCFAMLWLDRVRLPKPLRMSRLLWTMTFIAGVAMTSLGAIITVEYIKKMSRPESKVESPESRVRSRKLSRSRLSTLDPGQISSEIRPLQQSDQHVGKFPVGIS